MIKKTGDGGSVRSYGGDSPEDAMKVTRSIIDTETKWVPESE
jgi:hypothetical protein